jgi:hypothetical protein
MVIIDCKSFKLSLNFIWFDIFMYVLLYIQLLNDNLYPYILLKIIYIYISFYNVHNFNKW